MAGGVGPNVCVLETLATLVATEVGSLDGLHSMFLSLHPPVAILSIFTASLARNTCCGLSFVYPY